MGGGLRRDKSLFVIQTKACEWFLNERPRGATAYDRIAGYFSSSMLEVAGEGFNLLKLRRGLSVMQAFIYAVGVERLLFTEMPNLPLALQRPVSRSKE